MSDNQNAAEVYAEVYADAQLEPGKEDFQRRFLEREGLLNPGDTFTALAAWRLIDPEGQVGMEVAVIALNDGLVQVPLTYRPGPLPDTEGLLGEMAHSVLGTRYIYDARRDPVFAAALREVVRAGGQPVAKQNVKTGEIIPSPVRFQITPGEHTEVAVRVEEAFDDATLAAIPGTIVGTWDEEGQHRSAVLARPRA
ncbi:MULTISPECIES: maltokinase N-terminal cap-like domain-containing protein [unclassified Corynebacterium]|uniref:maltokinase N-terminal cap-like domain-containing protein n=1 Tax=unclassified Corynebacterium TaxID=2624378 RepID=UPI0029CA393B|nr:MULTISPECIES: hypothetical protein [unclassified Corynebacterium]WPF65539.1 hypothetical protein OLX12_08120 [Corynebacterium sp. 22KM0430]WPF68034.1 hypothetical protein OLW90_08115 [Corynebacterium sp. 21KM1197]